MAENNKVSSLKKSSDFRYIGQKGLKLRPTKWLTLTVLKHDTNDVFFGVIASRKIGSAVVRNKLKRWIRNLLKVDFFNQKFSGRNVVFSFRPMADGFYKELSFQDFKSAIENEKLR